MLNWVRCQFVLPVSVAFVLSGCFLFSSGPPKSTPTMIEVTLATAADVNPDARNRPSPIMVRFYELKSLTAFQAADFFSIFDRDKDILASELTARDEFSLAPNDRQGFSREPKAETKFIGVIAAFRDIDRAVWRASYEIPLNRATAVNVRLDARRITILAEPAKAKKVPAGSAKVPESVATPAAPSAPASPTAPTAPSAPAVPGR